jgi:hypothetical protein
MTVDTPSDDPWIDRVTLQNLLPLCPPEFLGAALEHGFSYASPPALDGPFAVRASFVNNVAPGPAWRGLRVSQPKLVSTRAGARGERAPAALGVALVRVRPPPRPRAPTASRCSSTSRSRPRCAARCCRAA